MINLKYFAIVLILMSPLLAFASYDHTKDEIKEFIVDEANRQGIEPALALAIAKVESDFDANALSHAGAKGVMQIMPATAEKVFGVSRYKLYDANINIVLGLRFIKQLLNTYNQRVDIALSHYNGGSAVKDKYGRLRVIPATKNYVHKVLKYQNQFQPIAKRLSLGQTSEKDGIKLTREQIAKKHRNLDDFYSFNLINKSKSIDSKTDVVRSTVKLSVEQESTYDKLEQLRALRVHNLMRNSHPRTSSTKTTSPQAIVNISMQPDKDFKDKRAKVLDWESILN